MLKKIKKNKLSLFLLAVVAMLSIYYVVMPGNDSGPTKPTGNLNNNTVTRYQEFAEARLSILDERNEEVANYEAKITDATVSMVELENYVKEIETITSLTEKEVYLESVIVHLGYEDCLVYLQETDNLTISVLTNEFTKTDYVSLAKAAKEEFGSSTLVTVKVVKSSS